MLDADRRSGGVSVTAGLVRVAGVGERPCGDGGARAGARPWPTRCASTRRCDGWCGAASTPSELTGLALTLALAIVVVAGVVVSFLALLVRRSEPLADARRGRGPSGRTATTATWCTGCCPTSPRSPRRRGVIVIAVAVGIIEWVRLPSRWIPAFLLVVTVGDSLVTNTVKGVVDRARPTIDPAAAALGPSFPSGHSSTAAAFFAALALLAGRRRSSARAGACWSVVAVGLAVAVACSRVLLDLHWVSDVVAGLALGWGWFAVCAIAFGGWLLRFGAAGGAGRRSRLRPERDSVVS